MPTAQELNEKTSARRSRAAKDQPEVVDLAAMRAKTEALHAAMMDAANRIIEIRRKTKELREEIKPLTAEVKLILDELESKGIDRHSTHHHIKLMSKSENERIKYEVSRRQWAKVCGWVDGEQLDLIGAQMQAEFEAKAKPEPGGDLKDGQADSIMEHIAKHGTTDATH